MPFLSTFGLPLLLPVAALAAGTGYSVKALATISTFAENIAIRSNSQLLITSLGATPLYSIDPNNPTPSAFPAIPDANGISGITEIQPDIFIVQAGQWNVSARRAAAGSEVLWSLNLRGEAPSFEKIVSIPQATALNGIAMIPGTNLVLSAESAEGVVYVIDVAQKTYKVAIDSPSFKPLDEPSSLGINGVRIHGSFLYFANSALGLFGRVPISKTGSATGDVEILATFNAPTLGIDDFAIDRKGKAWIAVHPDELDTVDGSGKVEVVVSGSEVPDPTSAAFGRGKGQEGILYVVTNVFHEDGSSTGGVAAVDVGDC